MRTTTILPRHIGKAPPFGLRLFLSSVALVVGVSGCALLSRSRDVAITVDNRSAKPLLLVDIVSHRAWELPPQKAVAVAATVTDETATFEIKTPAPGCNGIAERNVTDTGRSLDILIHEDGSVVMATGQPPPQPLAAATPSLDCMASAGPSS